MSYCATLKTWQVENVLRDELARMRQQRDHQDSDIFRAAHGLYRDAVRVLRERGEYVQEVDPDDL